MRIVTSLILIATSCSPSYIQAPFQPGPFGAAVTRGVECQTDRQTQSQHCSKPYIKCSRSLCLTIAITAAWHDAIHPQSTQQCCHRRAVKQILHHQVASTSNPRWKRTAAQLTIKQNTPCQKQSPSKALKCQQSQGTYLPILTAAWNVPSTLSSSNAAVTRRLSGGPRST